MIKSLLQGMAAEGGIGVFQDVHKLLEAGVVYIELAAGLVKLVKSEGSSVFLIRVPKVAIEGCKEGSEYVESYLVCFFTVYSIRSAAELGPHHSLCLTYYKLIYIANLGLGVWEAGSIAGGLQYELVFENFQFFSGSIKSFGIGYFLSWGCGLGGSGLGRAGKAVHDHFSIGQPLLLLPFAREAIVAL